MHSREGLRTRYLSEEWFAAVKACVEEAQKRGMKAWLYDEDRWPSGAAGGLVTRGNPQFAARALVCLVADSAEALGQLRPVLSPVHASGSAEATDDRDESQE